MLLVDGLGSLVFHNGTGQKESDGNDVAIFIQCAVSRVLMILWLKSTKEEGEVIQFLESADSVPRSTVEGLRAPGCLFSGAGTYLEVDFKR